MAPSSPLHFPGRVYCLHSSSVCNFCFSFSIFFSSRSRVLSFLRVPVPSSFFSSISSRTSEYSSWLVIPREKGWFAKSFDRVEASWPRPLSYQDPSPIRAQIVMSMSVTVLESSTMTVFTVPSNIRIFRGLCFFLYSMVSCKGRERWSGLI